MLFFLAGLASHVTVVEGRCHVGEHCSVIGVGSALAAGGDGSTFTVTGAHTQLYIPIWKAIMILKSAIKHAQTNP